MDGLGSMVPGDRIRHVYKPCFRGQCLFFQHFSLRRGDNYTLLQPGVCQPHRFVSASATLSVRSQRFQLLWGVPLAIRTILSSGCCSDRRTYLSTMGMNAPHFSCVATKWLVIISSNDFSTGSQIGRHALACESNENLTSSQMRKPSTSIFQFCCD